MEGGAVVVVVDGPAVVVGEGAVVVVEAAVVEVVVALVAVVVVAGSVDVEVHAETTRADAINNAIRVFMDSLSVVDRQTGATVFRFPVRSA